MDCKSSSVWLRLVRWKLNPWMMLVSSTYGAIAACGVEQDQQKIRFWMALAKINFARVYETINDFMNDMIWW
jgi:hypothetical protein